MGSVQKLVNENLSRNDDPPWPTLAQAGTRTYMKPLLLVPAFDLCMSQQDASLSVEVHCLREDVQTD